MMQLHMEDMEDHGRLNNLPLQGIPETEGGENVAEVVQSVFQHLTTTDATVLLDRAHRTLGPKSGVQGRPQDMLCRLHYYTVK